MSESLSFLTELQDIIRQRLDSPSADSYTASLAAGGIMKIAQKVGEEGVELALAAVAGTPGQQLDEAADLLYHLLVLLQAKRLSLGDVTERLRQRHLEANSR